jgi:hypothetical protein
MGDRYSQEKNMDSCAYDPETKQVYLRFGNVSVAIDIEEYMNMLYMLAAAKGVIEKDPEVAMGTYTDDNGVERQEFIVNDEGEEFS